MTYVDNIEKQNEELQQRLACAEKEIFEIKRPLSCDDLVKLLNKDEEMDTRMRGFIVRLSKLCISKVSITNRDFGSLTICKKGFNFWIDDILENGYKVDIMLKVAYRVSEQSLWQKIIRKPGCEYVSIYFHDKKSLDDNVTLRITNDEKFLNEIKQKVAINIYNLNIDNSTTVVDHIKIYIDYIKKYIP